jgi:hypothetical protein
MHSRSALTLFLLDATVDAVEVRAPRGPAAPGDSIGDLRDCEVDFARGPCGWPVVHVDSYI